MSDVYVYPDIEETIIDVLALIDDLPDITYGIGVPRGWKPGDTPHVQVRVDAPGADDMPVAGRATVSLIARAATTSLAKSTAATVAALLVSRYDLISASLLTGPLAERDPETNAELASTTLQVVARST